MVLRLEYKDICPFPTLRFHIEKSVFYLSACPPHLHEFAEIVFVQQGKGMHFFEGLEYPIEAGDIFVVRENELHGYHNIDGLVLCNIVFDPNIYLPSGTELRKLPGFHALFHIEPMLRQEHTFASRFHLNKEQMLRVYEIIAQLEDEYLRRDIGFEIMLRSYFTILVTYLAREFPAHEAAPFSEVTALSRVMAYLESHFSEAITLDDLVQLSNFSKSSLIRLFRRCLGTTPMSYLNDLRLRKARDLLLDSRLSVTEVAFSVGFSDSNYFSRQFRSKYFLSPRQYRYRNTTARGK